MVLVPFVTQISVRVRVRVMVVALDGHISRGLEVKNGYYSKYPAGGK